MEGMLIPYITNLQNTTGILLKPKIICHGERNQIYNILQIIYFKLYHIHKFKTINNNNKSVSISVIISHV